MASSIEDISAEGWQNIVETGEAYTEGTLAQAKFADTTDDIARLAFLILGVAATVSVSEFLSTPSYSSASSSSLTGTIFSCVGAWAASRCFDDTHAAQKLRDAQKLNNSPLSLVDLKTQTTTRERLLLMAEAYDTQSSHDQIDTNKIYSVFFRTLANHEELKYSRPKDFYKIKTRHNQLEVISRTSIVKNGQTIDRTNVEKFLAEFEAALKMPTLSPQEQDIPQNVIENITDAEANKTESSVTPEPCESF